MHCLVNKKQNTLRMSNIYETFSIMSPGSFVFSTRHLLMLRHGTFLRRIFSAACLHLLSFHFQNFYLILSSLVLSDYLLSLLTFDYLLYFFGHFEYTHFILYV